MEVTEKLQNRSGKQTVAGISKNINKSKSWREAQSLSYHKKFTSWKEIEVQIMAQTASISKWFVIENRQTTERMLEVNNEKKQGAKCPEIIADRKSSMAQK